MLPSGQVAMLKIIQEWQAKLRHRPILTGGFMRPSLFHGPLPRMKPQPPAISHLISRRIKKRDERRAKIESLEDVLEDIRIEESFEAGLQKLSKDNLAGAFLGSGPSWRMSFCTVLRINLFVLYHFRATHI